MRTKNKFLKNLLIVLGSLALSAIICEFKGDAWEGSVRKGFYSVTHDTITTYGSIILDEKGIPYVYYPAMNGVAAGNEYNPTIICNYAIDYYQLAEEKNDSATKNKFGHCIEWLAKNISYKDGYAHYEFNWQQPFYDSVGVPWTSGMTSGRAIEAFTDAYKLTHAPEWLDHASALLRGFYYPIDSGGFTYREPGGWWYEEYAHRAMHTPRVLDGHIYAFMGVRTFWLLTKNDSAAKVVEEGIRALKDHLPGYDKGDGDIFYDAYHKVADQKYHELLTSMMKALWDITQDRIFYEYYHKWEAPLKKPYVYRIFKQRNRSGLVLYFLVSALVFLVLTGINRLIRKKS